jgi:hypothetical protein
MWRCTRSRPVRAPLSIICGLRTATSSAGAPGSCTLAATPPGTRRSAMTMPIAAGSRQSISQRPASSIATRVQLAWLAARAVAPGSAAAVPAARRVRCAATGGYIAATRRTSRCMHSRPVRAPLSIICGLRTATSSAGAPGSCTLAATPPGTRRSAMPTPTAGGSRRCISRQRASSIATRALLDWLAAADRRLAQ